MKLARIHSTLATVALGLASFGAQAVIVNIDAQSSTGTTIVLDAGTYTLTWAGIAGGGLYDAWQYNTASSGNFRDTFTVSSGSVTRSYDLNDGNALFNNYLSATAALSAFQSASGADQFVVYGGGSDSSPTGELKSAPFSFTFSAPTTLTFSVPDNVLWDNKGGVSLAITAAVPEPETYALMLGGLGALAFVARRRKSSSNAA